MSAPTDVVEQADAAAARTARRRAWGWVALVAAIVVAGLVIVVVPTQQWRDKDPLDPEHAGPAGAMALARLLEDQGVDIEIVRDLDEASAAAEGGALAVTETGYLGDDGLSDLLASPSRVVLLDPSSRDARLAFGGDAPLNAGTGTGPTAPSCDLPEAVTAGEVTPGRLWSRGSADTACYPTDDGYGLLSGDVSGTRVTLLDGRALFSNGVLAEKGNASLGLGLLGSDEHLVWYVPTPGDADPATVPPSLGDLTPPWLTAAITMLALAVIAAAVWRGRRFGPLVAETLPVTVRGSETLEGRARLYQRSGDAAHAADLVRAGAASRIGRRLGLRARADLAEVADAAAARIGAGRADVAAILDARPTTDAELAEVGQKLSDLEAAVDAAVRTERKTL